MEIKTPDHRQLHLRGGNEENDRCGQQRSQDMTECVRVCLLISRCPKTDGYLSAVVPALRAHFAVPKLQLAAQLAPAS
jgi:hypothetical protein